MGMSTGDFSVVFGQIEFKEHFDAVTTCFFIDTAPNVIKYIETINHCLKQGGIWINIGPLLWHFESTPTPAERDRQRQHSHSNFTQWPTFTKMEEQMEQKGIGEPGSFELSKDEVVELVKRLGFDILEVKDAPGGAHGYLQDPGMSCSLVQCCRCGILSQKSGDPYSLYRQHATECLRTSILGGKEALI